ncbi:ABC transporter substrate-binding protein [Lachnoclostridium phytofermentans]|uniref:Extracellular solute-binding protein family 1 n=1 Tax=Lachnoclostridium phytofermentans (strain ATCC 700394 / DSM 18823 / ISDg) TaxID=357809 RepID=A9KPA5_LACP7|nr:extracellular solute-binding protein [Lachnoclostridium phytofermentans]ABX41767.1 extracellular solute-binding protein family 1 [Lachnoclostridium phytofermentans ISDg]
MKKILVLFMVFTLSVSTLVGCGGKTDEKTGTTPTTKGTSDEVIELTYLTYNGTRDAAGNLIVQNMADAYMAEHQNVKIIVDIQAENNSTDFLTKLDLLQLTGQTGDIIQIPSYREYAPRAAEGFFASINDVLTSEGIKYDDVYAYPSVVNGTYYGIPSEPGIYVVFINKEMLDEAGLPIPKEGWTWDDYRDYAVAMTKGEGANKVYGSYLHTWSEFRREGLYNAVLDNPFIKADGTSNLDSPLFGEWLQFMYDIENTYGCQVPYADAKATSMAYRDVFLQGKAAMTVIGTWVYSDIVNTETYPHDFQTVTAPFPVFADGKAGVTQGGISYNCVGAGTEHVKEAYDFARYMSNEGAVSQNIFPATKDGDIVSVLKAKVGDRTDLVDIDSAVKVWTSNDLVPNIVTNKPDKFVEIDSIFNTESEKFLLGGQNLETTLKNLQDQGNAIINQK